MDKGAQGTEYVNAKLEELKETIDEYAKRIAGMTMGAIVGMVWMRVFEGSGGAVVVYITGDGFVRYYDSAARAYKRAFRYTLHAACAFNGGGGWSRTVDATIPDSVKPKSTVTVSIWPYWYDYSPDVPCSVSLNKSGKITVTIGNGPSGQANSSSSWYRSGNNAK